MSLEGFANEEAPSTQMLWPVHGIPVCATRCFKQAPDLPVGISFVGLWQGGLRGCRIASARVYKSKKRRGGKKATESSKRFGGARGEPSFETAAKLMTAGIPLDDYFERQRQQRLEKMKAQLNALILMGRGAEAVDQMLLAVRAAE